MRHVIVSREYPPANYPAGGIGTYVANIANLLAARGDTVHVIAERWAGAPLHHEVRADGHLFVHRLGADDLPETGGDPALVQAQLRALRRTEFPAQWFGWSAAFLIERLLREERIDTIEGQEWEAPLYPYLLRRSLGLGPDAPGQSPPVIVHLHSPTAFIHHYNGPPALPAALQAMTRMEEFCIRAADALLCPSQSLSRQAASHFGLPPRRIETIPLPSGLTPVIERSPTTWQSGSVAFVGRLEPRKGIIEWVEACARVAPRYPEARFDFVGADVWDLAADFRRRLGSELAPRFRFHGQKPREQIATILAGACAAAVPSRWENFPNVCIEAMAGGLPVIATRYGGMEEMVEDGQTGWLAEDLGIGGMVPSLAAALERCLQASGEERARMGEQAAASIRQYCDNEAVVARHRAFRSALARKGLRKRGGAAGSFASHRGPLPTSGVVVRCRTAGEAEPVLATIAAQDPPPIAVVLVHAQPLPPGWRERQAAFPRLATIQSPHAAGPEGWNEALYSSEGVRPGFWLFLSPEDRLLPGALRQMADVLACRPDIGIVSPWTLGAGATPSIQAPPVPSAHWQMAANDVAPASGWRNEALGAHRFRPGLPPGYDTWALANAVIADGWGATTLPEALAQRDGAGDDGWWAQDTALRAIRAETLAPLRNPGTRLALQVFEEHVPPRQRKRGGDGAVRMKLLRGMETLLFRPGALVRRCLRAAGLRKGAGA